MHLPTPIAAIFGGHWEVIILLLLILVLFGTRLPKVARSLGQGINQFKKGLHEPVTDDPTANGDPAKPAPQERSQV